MTASSKERDRLLGIYFGVVLGALGGLAISLSLKILVGFNPVVSLVAALGTGVLFGRFPLVFQIVCWVWAFPSGFEDRFLGGDTRRRQEIDETRIFRGHDDEH